MIKKAKHAYLILYAKELVFVMDKDKYMVIIRALQINVFALILKVIQVAIAIVLANLMPCKLI